MKKNVKRQIILRIMTLFVFLAIGVWLPVGLHEVKAADEEHTVNGAADLGVMANECSYGQSGVSYNIEVGADFAVTNANLTQPLVLIKNSFTLDLKGHTIDARGYTGSQQLFLNNGCDFTIKDSVGGGKILAPDNGVIVKTQSGKLKITGGAFEAKKQCLDITGTNVEITGGTFKSTGNATDDNGCALIIRENNSNVKISGDSFFESNYVTIWVFHNVTNSSLNIEGGYFKANDNGNTNSDRDVFSYACYVDGACNMNISGGTFHLNETAGSALCIGTATTDDMVNFTGGTFHGRIARKITNLATPNDTVFYGDENGNSGVIGAGYVLTDNVFYREQGYDEIVFSKDEVVVCPGYRLKLDTRRSALETYADSESELAQKADTSLLPISVGAGGVIYPNSDHTVTPTLDTSRVTDGNAYEFIGWCSDEGREYTSVNEYLAEQTAQGGLSANKVLGAVWKAKVHTKEGLERAIKSSHAVKNVELTDNIILTSSIAEDAMVVPLKQKTLDLAGKKLSFEGLNMSGPGLVLKSEWNIKNGTITSLNQACMQLDGTTVLDNVTCKTQGNCAVVFRNVTAGSLSKIISGTFETTATGGYALQTVNSGGVGSVSDITNLFRESNSSCMSARVEGANVYLNARKLLVSQSPITYIGNNEDVNLGSYIYGENITPVTQTMNNLSGVGDITVTGVSVDNVAFTVIGDTTGKELIGGSTDTYSYEIKATGTPVPGTYEGIVSVNYTKMDGEAGVCSQKVSMTIAQKQLTITEPTLAKTKTYDGKTTASITAGALNGVVLGDDVAVTATAKYNSATAGSKKTIAVSYTLTGAAKGNYIAPVNVSYSDCVINKAAGKASVSIADYHIGEKAKAKISSSTNGTKSVKFSFKKKGEADSTYTSTVPDKEGTYTVRAVFAATANYKEVTATANFKVSYIDTPKNPYTLKGTKGKNGWYISNVTITPANGYTISEKQNGTYKSSYTVDATVQPVIYLKNAGGAITKGIKLSKIEIDKALPKISGVQNGETYYEDEVKASVSDSNLSSVTLNGKNVSFNGQSVTVTMKPSDTKYTLVAIDKAGNKVEYTIRVEDSWMKDGVVSNGKKKLIKKKSYKLGSGQWKVSGDNTIYNGDMNFYVSADGEYDFTKQ